MLRFGNPYTRDSSAAARVGRAAATAIAHGGRSGGVANENSNRDMSHRVVSALAQVCRCPAVAAPIPPEPPVPPESDCVPMSHDWLRYGPYMAPTWSLTDLCDGCVTTATVTAERRVTLYDPCGAVVGGPVPGLMDPPILTNFGAVTGFSVTGAVQWITRIESVEGGPLFLTKVVQGSNGKLYVGGSWLSAGIITLTQGATSVSATVAGGSTNVFVGCLTANGTPLWVSQVTLSGMLGSESVSFVDIAVSEDGERVGIFLRALRNRLGPVLTFYDAVGGSETRSLPTNGVGALFLYSLNASGLDHRICKFEPPSSIGSNSFGVNLLCQGGSFTMTAYADGSGSAPGLITDSAGGFTPFFLQPALLETGLVFQCDLLARLQWWTRAVGDTGVVASTPINTFSSSAYQYQRGAIWDGSRLIYTGTYNCTVGNVIRLEQRGVSGSGVTFASLLSEKGIYIGRADASGSQLPAAHMELVDISGTAAAIVISTALDASDQSVYLLVRVTNGGDTGVSRALFYDTAGAVSWSPPGGGLLVGMGFHLLVKYSAAGSVVWGRVVGGIGGDQYYGTMTVTTQGCPVVFGPFMGEGGAVFYDGTGGVVGTLAQTGPRDMYLAKWTTEGDFVGVAGFQGENGNDANVWMQSAGAGALYTLFDYWSPMTVTNMGGGGAVTLPTGLGPAFAGNTFGLARWVSS